MFEQGYTRCHSDHCVYLKRQNDGNYIILILYVDDMLVAGSNMQEIGRASCRERVSSPV